MARLPDSGEGNFGVLVEFEDGDTEKAWRKTELERQKLYNHERRAPGVKNVTKIQR